MSVQFWVSLQQYNIIQHTANRNNIDYTGPWTQKIGPIAHQHRWAMGFCIWKYFGRKLTMLWCDYTVLRISQHSKLLNALAWCQIGTRLIQLAASYAHLHPCCMMTSSNGNIFLRYWPIVRGIHWPPVNSPHKGQWRGALIFSLICAWINGWVNNHEAGDLRCHHAHYNVTVMN